jgi:hypothetical protein
MRFLREMIVRKSAAGVPGDAVDEPPVKDFFELPPMRDRLARSRSVDLDARASDMDDDDPEDAGDVASMVAERLSAARHVPVEKPRDDRARVASDGFDDLEFGDFDPEELDALDLDAPAEPVVPARPVAPTPVRAPHLSRRAMSPPVGWDAAEAADAGAHGTDEDAGADDLTDDPALAAMVAGRRSAAPVAQAAMRAADPVVPDPVMPQAVADDESAILANIAAALPSAARAMIPAAAPPVAAPVVAPPVRAELAPESPARMEEPAPVQPAPMQPAPVQHAHGQAPAPVHAPAPAAAAAPVPRAPRIWDLEPEAQEAAVMRFAETAAPPPRAASPSPSPVPAPAPVPASEPPATEAPRRSGRVRTRLLGFTATEDIVPDPIAGATVPRAAGPAQFPVGWIVVTDGPGRGAAFTLGAGVSSIGRDEDQVIQLDFGDTAISRHMHAAIAYDPETRGFFLGQGGKSNIVRLNGRPVLSTEDLKDGDVIRIGETTLKLVAFCGRHFDWADAAADQTPGARGDAAR